jgi:hypothetical protein
MAIGKTRVDAVETDSITGKAGTSVNVASVVLDAGTINGNLKDSTYGDFLEGSAPATPAAGRVRLYSKTDKKFYLKDDTGNESPIGSGTSVTKIIEAAHGFIVGDTVYAVSATNFEGAKNDDEVKAEAIGVVSKVLDAGNYEITTQGEISGLTSANFVEGVLPADGSQMFLSGTAKKFQATNPNIGGIVGTISKCMGTYLGGGKAIVKIDPGVVVGGTNVQQSASLLNNTASQFIVNLTGINGGYINAVVFVDATTDVRQEFLLLFSKNAVGTTWSVSTISTSGENSLTTFDIDTSGILRASVGSHAGFVSGLCTYSINSPALGATFPQVVSASNVLGSTTGIAPAAGVIGQVAMNQANGGVTATYGAGAVTVSSSTLTTGTYLVFCDVTGYNNNRPSAGSGTQTLEIQVNSVKIAEALYLAPWYSTPDSSNDVSHFCMVLIGTVTVPSGATHAVNTLMTAISNSGTPTGYSCTTRTSGKLMAIRIA